LRPPCSGGGSPKKRIERAPVVEAIKRQPKSIILTALARTGEQAPSYIYLAFVLAYGTQILHIQRDFLLTSLSAAGITSFVTIPLAGHLSDRIGRRRMYIIGAAATGIVGFIYFAMLNTTVAWIFLGIVLSFIANDLMYGPQAALIAECFTPRLRYTGASIGYQLSSIISGGPAPLIATALFAAFGSGYVIALYILFCAIVSIVVAALLPDYTNRDISEEHAKP
jgi:MFS family permease